MVALATACLLCSVVALGADELSPDRLLAEWEASAQQIWSFDVTFELAVDSRPERSQPLAPVLRHVLRQRYLRGRWRVDDLAGGIAGSASAEPYETPEGHTNAFAMQQLVVRRYDSQQQFGSITSRTTGTPSYALPNPTGPDVLVPAEAVPNTLLDDRHR